MISHLDFIADCHNDVVMGVRGKDIVCGIPRVQRSMRIHLHSAVLKLQFVVCEVLLCIDGDRPAFQIALRQADHCASARLLGEPHGAEHLPRARIGTASAAAAAATAGCATATATATGCFRSGATATAAGCATSTSTGCFRGGATATAAGCATATSTSTGCFRSGATATAAGCATSTSTSTGCFRSGATATAAGCATSTSTGCFRGGATATAAGCATATATAATSGSCRASSIITKPSELVGHKPLALALALHPMWHATHDVLEHRVLRASVSGQHSARLPNRLQALRFGLAARGSFFRGSEVGNIAKHSTLQARWHVRSFWHQIISINTRGIHCTVAFIQLLLFSP